MDSLSISENILRSLEERRQRRGEKTREKEEEKALRSPPKEVEDALISACASDLEDTVRESIRSSFAKWQAGLVKDVERIAGRASITPESAGGRSGAAPSHSPPGALPLPVSRSGFALDDRRADLPRKAPPEAPRPEGGGHHHGEASSEGESWGELVEAVKELRREWDQETFEKCFGDEPDLAAAGAGPPRAAALPPPVKEALPPPVKEALPLPVKEALPLPVKEAAAREGGESPLIEPPEDSRDSGEAEAASDEMARKLDELLRLMKGSLRPEGKAPREVSSEIAREVAGRLRETLASLAQGPVASPEKVPPAPQEARIPLGDISAMIDQITGIKRP